MDCSSKDKTNFILIEFSTPLLNSRNAVKPVNSGILWAEMNFRYSQELRRIQRLRSYFLGMLLVFIYLANRELLIDIHEKCSVFPLSVNDLSFAVHRLICSEISEANISPAINSFRYWRVSLYFVFHNMNMWVLFIHYSLEYTTYKLLGICADHCISYICACATNKNRSNSINRRWNVNANRAQIGRVFFFLLNKQIQIVLSCPSCDL